MLKKLVFALLMAVAVVVPALAMSGKAAADCSSGCCPLCPF